MASNFTYNSYLQPCSTCENILYSSTVVRWLAEFTHMIPFFPKATSNLVNLPISPNRSTRRPCRQRGTASNIPPFNYPSSSFVLYPLLMHDSLPPTNRFHSVTRQYTTPPTARLGLLRLVAPSNSSPPNTQSCVPFISTIYDSDVLTLMMPITQSLGVGMQMVGSCDRARVGGWLFQSIERQPA